MKKKVKAYFYGEVQGVCFRANTERKARELGVSGWVKNLADGKVELTAEGEEEKLKELIEFCKKADFNGAKVKRIEVKWGESKGELVGFKILYRD